MPRPVLIVSLLALHMASATIDVSAIPEKLHKLTELKTAALQSAAAKLQDLKETAAYNIKHIADDIDLNNLHKLDILQIGPTLQKKYNLLKKLYNKPATKVNVVHIYEDDWGPYFHDYANYLKHKNHGHHGHHGHHHDSYHELHSWA